MIWIALLPPLLLASPAWAQNEDNAQRYADHEFYSEMIHSDLPLYNFEWDDLWPRNFSEGEGEDFTFGCMSRFRFGEYQFTPNESDEYGDSWWLRIDNYGVFHCAANFHTAYERAELEDGEFSRGYLVRLGAIDDTELWAIQDGIIPGSSYTLLAKPRSDAISQDFTVLQRRCPDGAMRALAGGFDTWSTDYCAINSREALLALAKDMLSLPPLGTLNWRGDVERQEVDASDPFEMEDMGPVVE